MFDKVYSERQLMEKINKIKAKSTKRLSKIEDDFAQIQKTRADALKRAEDLKRYSEGNLSKIEQIITKSKDLAPESVQRLNAEIVATKASTNVIYSKLKGELIQTVLPEFPKEVEFRANVQETVENA